MPINSLDAATTAVVHALVDANRGESWKFCATCLDGPPQGIWAGMISG